MSRFTCVRNRLGSAQRLEIIKSRGELGALRVGVLHLVRRETQ